MYGYDLSLYDFGVSDQTIFDSLSQISSSTTTIRKFYNDDGDDNEDVVDYYKQSPVMAKKRTISPPKHRHDGSSPLPFGMDWSPPPRKWNGRDSVWPQDPHAGWSYCVTIPSWITLPLSRGSDPVVFYRVQIGIQSPDGITTTHGILRRFSDFLKLFPELKKAFPKKNFPPAPSKRLLRMTSRTLLEERRSSLEDWLEKLLSDIDLSRSAPLAIFLELEAAARSSFHDSNPQASDTNASTDSLVLSNQFQLNSEVSLLAGSSSIASDYGDFAYETSDLGTPRKGRDKYSEVGEITLKALFHSDHEIEALSESEIRKSHNHLRKLSNGSVGSDLGSSKASEILDLGFVAEAPRTMDLHTSTSIEMPSGLFVALPSDERPKMNRVLVNMQRRLATAKTDMEDLVARLNQELAVRQYLTTKVKDLEVELETTRQSGKENLQQAVLIERERFTQTQWDIEELRRLVMETELKLKCEQDEKAHLELAKISISQENEMLLQELDVARQELENSRRHHEELEMKSKVDVKLLVKEVKSLRSSQSDLKKELSRLMKEKSELERVVLKEKQRWEHANSANAKLLHECEILHRRLEECSVNFLIEEEDKLIMDTSSPSDAIDLLTTSDNRIGLLLAEAQLLAQDVENATLSSTHNIDDGGNRRTSDDELRKMVTDIFIDNASLRKQVNSVIRCALNTPEKPENDEEEEEEEEAPSRNTILSKFLER